MARESLTKQRLPEQLQEVSAKTTRLCLALLSGGCALAVRGEGGVGDITWVSAGAGRAPKWEGRCFKDQSSEETEVELWTSAKGKEQRKAFNWR